MTSKELKPANFINIHCHRLSSGKSIFSYNPGLNFLPPQVLFSVGLHPWSLSEEIIPGLQAMGEVYTLSHAKECLIIGETGIDRLKGPNLEIQEASMKEHIKISEELSKPLILHNVRGLDIILKLHRQTRPSQAWILHDFNGNDIQIKQIKGKNIFTSLGPTFMRENSKIAQFAIELELSKIFFETDDEPSLKISDVYRKFAALREIELSKLCEQVKDNFTNLFGPNA